MKRAQTFVAMLAYPLILNACSIGDKVSDLEINEAQSSSFMGSSNQVEFSDTQDERTFKDRRDRAYRFCFEKHGAEAAQKQCFDEQDLSLFAARNAISYAESIQSNGLKVDDFEFGPLTPEFILFHHPELWTEARAYCFSIYDDAGQQDARMLGPCLSEAVGGDFFGMRGTT